MLPRCTFERHLRIWTYVYRRFGLAGAESTSFVERNRQASPAGEAPQIEESSKRVACTPFGTFLIPKCAQNQCHSSIYRKAIHWNIPDCHKWTEESIIIKKRPFGTFAIASAFSHPGLGLVNNLDSKKC